MKKILNLKKCDMKIFHLGGEDIKIEFKTENM